MPSLRISHLRRRFGATDVLSGVSLEVKVGDLLAVVGPEGAGKSILLKVLAGLQPADEGQVFLGERDITQLPLRDRAVAWVSQTLATFQGLSVSEVVLDAASAPATLTRAQATLELVGAAAVKSRPWAELSAAMQQRVVLARALTLNPSLLLLDEPFSQIALSARDDLLARLKPYLRAQSITTVLVTHDFSQALAYADDLAVLQKGKVLQSGRPLDCYRRPVNASVAQILGQANLIPATLVRQAAGEGVVRSALGDVSGALAQPNQPPAEGADIILCIRPEALRLDTQGPEDNAWRGKIVSSQFAGDLTRHVFLTDTGVSLRITEANARQRLHSTTTRVAWIEPEDVLILSQ